MEVHRLTCKYTRPGHGRPCGHMLALCAYAVEWTRVVGKLDDVDLPGGCFGYYCRHCKRVTEYTYAVDLSLPPFLILARVPFMYAAHQALADRWRAGTLVEGTPSYRLMWGWTAAFGVPTPVDYQLTVYADLHPPRQGEPQGWPNGQTDVHMPGNIPDLSRDHLG